MHNFLAPLALFAFVASITPGPNNVMLASAGLTYGFRRSIPHMLGICCGFMLLILLVGLGLGTAFHRWPVLSMALKWVSTVYLLYLALRIALAAAPHPDAKPRRPFGFWQAAGFQWVNPKAWVMAIGAVAAYVPLGGYASNLVLATLLCGLVNLPCISAWTLSGLALRRFLRSPTAVRGFNVAMAALLLASLYPVARELWAAAAGQR